MIPIACRTIIFVVIAIVTVIRVTGRLALACAGLGICVHLVRAADPRSIRFERTIRAEIQLREFAPAADGCSVVNHDIGNYTCAVLMEGLNHLLQFLLRAPIAVQVAVVRRDITRSAGRLRHRRQPDQVEPFTQLLCGRTAVAVQMIDPLGTAITLILIAVPIESLDHHVRTLRRSRSGITRLRNRSITTTGLTALYIDQVAGLHTQLDIEIILTCYITGQLVSFFTTREVLIVTILIQVHHPRRAATLVDQLNHITCFQLHARSHILLTSIIIRVSVQRRIHYRRTIDLQSVRAVLAFAFTAAAGAGTDIQHIAFIST